MNFIDRINRKNILIVGDIMLDQYYMGNVSRISPEAPIPVLQKQGEKNALGGAANVAANLVTAGQNVYMMSVIGDDEAGKLLLSLLKSTGVDCSLVIKSNRNTTVKARFLAANNQQLLRMDIEDIKDITQSVTDRMIDRLKKVIASFDLIILSDYMKGILTYHLTQEIIKVSAHYGIRVLIDVKDPEYEKYKDSFLLKPNLKELKLLTNKSVETEHEVIDASRFLIEKTNCQYVLTTCGAGGMVLVGDKDHYKVASVGKEVYDVTGAGDTVIAYLAVCLANQIEIKDAVLIANYAAGVQVGKVGTSAITLKEVDDALWEHGNLNRRKLLIDGELLKFRPKNKDKKIVFTNGCFDILHTGHVRYLQEAAKLGDILVVGLNSDSSVKRLKGKSRPINSERDRAELLCALDCVAYVAIFDEDTPLNLIQIIQPDILVKGGDYRKENVIGKEIVEATGGEVVILPFVQGKSTTMIINNIRGKSNE